MKATSIQQFSWDDAKDRANERKHGISFQLAATVFRDQSALVCHDVRHDGPDDRWHVVGMGQGGVLIVVVCTFDDINAGEHVRIISARKATLRERRAYETGEYFIREPETAEEYIVTHEKEDDPDMKAEYDFSKGVRGRFAHWRLPVYVENSILGYFHQRSLATGIPGDELINEVLRQHVAATGYVAPVFSDSR
jgi:uncharacterized protein